MFHILIHSECRNLVEFSFCFHKVACVACTEKLYLCESMAMNRAEVSNFRLIKLHHSLFILTWCSIFFFNYFICVVEILLERKQFNTWILGTVLVKWIKINVVMHICSGHFWSLIFPVCIRSFCEVWMNGNLLSRQYLSISSTIYLTSL